MLFSNINRVGINVVPRRFARRKVILKSWPNDWVPFIWNRPEKEPGYLNAGDLVDLCKPEKGDLLPEVRNSPDLNQMDADNPIRKIFSIDHATTGAFNKAQVRNQFNERGLVHEVDYANSLEAKIIKLTFTLRHLYHNIEDSKGRENFNGHIRMAANNVKYRRHSYLCDLMELHRERYERLMKALNIEPPRNLINVPRVQPFRKVEMRILAQKYAQDLKEKKVEEFMKSLEKEKEEFQKYKEETLKWIEDKEKQLGVTV